MQKVKLIITVLLSSLLVGCTPLFVKEDEPIILNNATGLTENQTLLRESATAENEVLIKSINSNLIDGLVYDISDDGNSLLMGGPSSALSGNVEFNLHTYNMENNQLKQVLLSSKAQINALFDKRNKGMIYVEYNKNEDGKAIEDSYRLNWTNYEGNITKNISTAAESVSPEFSLINDELIIYGNSKGEIKMVEARDIPRETIRRKTYSLSENLNIYKVDYYQDYNLAFFLAINPVTKVLDLYYAVLEETEVNPILVEENVTDFDISPKNRCVLFNVSGEKTNQLISVDMYYNKETIYEGPVSMFYYTLDEERIIYGEKVDNSSNNQNLWIMKSDGTESMQLASNLKIAGDNIIFDPNENAIFFSVFQLENTTESSTNALNYRVYMIEFSYSG